jgi:hypothetical protein
MANNIYIVLTFFNLPCVQYLFWIVEMWKTAVLKLSMAVISLDLLMYLLLVLLL